MKPCAATVPSRLPRLLLYAGLLGTLLAVSPGPALAQLDTLRDLLPDALHQTLFGSDAYRVEFQGELEPEVMAVLQSVSAAYALRDRSPASPQILERRARMDVPELLRGLRSEGYYDGHVEVLVDHDATPPLVAFQVRTGPAYTLEAVYFDNRVAEDDFSFPALSAETVNLTLNDRARAPEIEQGAAGIRRFLREHGHPFPEIALREALVDHGARTMTVSYTYDPGPSIRFGPIQVQGERRVATDYILGKVPWSGDQPFRSALLTRLRTELMQTGLFSLVDVSHPDAPLDDGTLPVTISVAERVPRTVKAGLAYETDTGLGAALEWEHRNIFGRGEQLRTRLDLAEKKQLLSADFQIPDFLDKSQTLAIQGSIGQEESDALESRGIAAGAKVNRQLDQFWFAGLGINFRVTEITQLGETQTFGLISTPGELVWDKRNNVLDPTAGWRAQIRAEPFLDTLDWDTTFFKLSGALSAYLSILSEDRLVLAARGAMGSIMGETNLSLPADERFYAGGGGSVRGYSYQSIGPEEDGEIVGGRSMVEVGTELRLRLKNNFGLVVFLDGGQVFTESELQFKDDFIWGAGLGLRYYTDFAPIRLDVAFPLNRRDRDDAFQVYVSIGQAF